MKKKKLFSVLVMAGLSLSIIAECTMNVLPVSASTEHYNDSSVTGAGSGWDEWAANWEETAADYTKVSITPGEDETKLNFAWYSKYSKETTPIVLFGTSKDQLKEYKGTVGSVETDLTGGEAYQYNHVTVTGLKENTTYYYTVEKNGIQSEVRKYTTGSFENVNILYVGDPQIGASKGQPQNGEKLTNTSGAANTAARNDGFA